MSSWLCVLLALFVAYTGSAFVEDRDLTDCEIEQLIDSVDLAELDEEIDDEAIDELLALEFDDEDEGTDEDYPDTITLGDGSDEDHQYS